MSGVYAYCVVSGGRQPPASLSGLEDRPVTGHEVDGLTLWVTEADEPPALDLDAVARHHAVVSAALGTSMLPLRFGAWQPDLESLAERVRSSSAELAATLRRVAGRVELGIRVVRAGPKPDAPGVDLEGAASGRDYLRALSRRRSTRVERRRAQDGLVRRLEAHLGEMAAEQRVQYLSPPEIISVAHLVLPSDERRYRERAARFARDADDELVVHVTGPWPPYSFAS